MRKLGDIVFEQEPLILKATEPVEVGCRLMDDRRAGSVLVCDDAGRLVGILPGEMPSAVCWRVARTPPAARWPRR